MRQSKVFNFPRLRPQSAELAQAPETGYLAFTLCTKTKTSNHKDLGKANYRLLILMVGGTCIYSSSRGLHSRRMGGWDSL